MTMLEFVTVKDQLLAFLKTHQDEAIETNIINNDLIFHSLPNGVLEACIEEMERDNVIKVQRVKAKDLLGITDTGKRLLGAGGYSKKLIEEKKARAMADSTSDPLYMPNTLYKRNRQIALITNTVNALSIVSAVLFKRI
jgi:hypothetical protein